jgi:two-component system NtrC family response regulator
LPPLRERRKDIPLLIKYFSVKHGSDKIIFDKEALEALSMFSWPGNVRELENTVERLLIMRSSDVIRFCDLPDKFREKSTRKNGVVRLPDEGYSLEQLEREIVIEALERNAWNQTAAARFLRIPRHTLIYRIEKYNIEQEKKC